MTAARESGQRKYRQTCLMEAPLLLSVAAATAQTWKPRELSLLCLDSKSGQRL